MLVPTLLLLLSDDALANGQSSHLWITLHALEHLPPGDLRDLLMDPALQPMLLNGTMFPDGGYAVDDGYGEIAHWEPLQTAYRDWIRARYDLPFSDEGAEHVAFLMGLGSHGMADQVFDALYMERAKQNDADSDWQNLSMDTATDVTYMAQVGPLDYPDHWIPGEAMIEVFREDLGHEVSLDTLEQGQALLRVAIAYVGSTSQIPEEVDRYTAQFPWATTHQEDVTVPGSPPCEGRILARYWENLWLRLQGDFAAGSTVLATFPANGAYEHETDHSRVEARISLVFSQAIDASTITDETLHILDPDGQRVPASLWMFYGNNSHVLHAAPQADLLPDTTYTVTLVDPPVTIDGIDVQAAGYTFTFSTGTAPAAAPIADDQEAAGAGCATLPGAPLRRGGEGMGALVVVGLSLRRRRRRRGAGCGMRAVR